MEFKCVQRGGGRACLAGGGHACYVVIIYVLFNMLMNVGRGSHIL